MRTEQCSLRQNEVDCERVLESSLAAIALAAVPTDGW